MWDVQSADVAADLSVPFGLVENAYVRLARRVQEMSLEELEYTGTDGNINSTATLLAHIAYTDLDYLHRIKGESVPPHLEMEYGPDRAEDDTLPRVTGKTAAELLGRCQAVLGMVRAYLASLPDGHAARPVEIPWWPEPATVRYVLWHMASHTSMHIGNIDRLKASYQQREVR